LGSVVRFNERDVRRMLGIVLVRRVVIIHTYPTSYRYRSAYLTYGIYVKAQTLRWRKHCAMTDVVPWVELSTSFSSLWF